jgi:hypothetical protein
VVACYFLFVFVVNSFYQNSKPLFLIIDRKSKVFEKMFESWTSPEVNSRWSQKTYKRPVFLG